MTAVEDRKSAPDATDAAAVPAEKKPKKQRIKYNRRETFAAYMFIAPWIIGFLVFTLGAMIYSLVISFSNYDLATDTAVPNGGANYTQLLEDPRVMLSLG